MGRVGGSGPLDSCGPCCSLYMNVTWPCQTLFMAIGCCDVADRRRHVHGRISPCIPRLFVYELPKGYRHEGRPSGKLLPASARPLMVTSSGNASHTVKLQRHVNYQTGTGYFLRAAQHRCRTIIPEEADLFFVPAFTDYQPPSRNRLCEAECASGLQPALRNLVGTQKYNYTEVDVLARSVCDADALVHRLDAVRQLESNMSYLERHSGRDHLLLSPRHGLTMDALPCHFEYNLDSPRFANAMRLAIEEATPHPLRKTYYMPNFHSVPPLSIVHAPARDVWPDLAWRRLHPRPLLVGGVFSVGRHRGANNGAPELRFALNASCAKVSPSTCTIQVCTPRKPPFTCQASERPFRRQVDS